MRVLVGPHVLGETREHPERVLQAVPARDLHDERDVEPELVLLDHLRRRLHAADAAVEPLEDRP